MRKIGFLLLCATLLAFAGGWVWSDTRSTTPVDIPLSADSAHTRTQEFTLNVDYRYLIEIGSKATLSPKVESCLLAAQIAGRRPDCGEPGTGVPIKWAVSTQGHTIEEGTGNGLVTGFSSTNGY